MANPPPHELALTYLNENNLIKLFDILGAKLAFDQPDDPNEYLVKELRRIEDLKKRGKKYTLFEEKDVEAMFLSFDLTQRGFVTKDQYLQGKLQLCTRFF